MTVKHLTLAQLLKKACSKPNQMRDRFGRCVAKHPKSRSQSPDYKFNLRTKRFVKRSKPKTTVPRTFVSKLRMPCKKPGMVRSRVTGVCQRPVSDKSKNPNYVFDRVTKRWRLRKAAGKPVKKVTKKVIKKKPVKKVLKKKPAKKVLKKKVSKK